jgi:haloacetate dehalogenase
LVLADPAGAVSGNPDRTRPGLLRPLRHGRPPWRAGHLRARSAGGIRTLRRQPGWATGICEDYRASASIDLEHDRADRQAGRLLRLPLRVLWGARGAVGKNFDVLALWRNVASDVSGQALDAAHYLAEEAPQDLLREVESFFPQ